SHIILVILGSCSDLCLITVFVFLFHDTATTKIYTLSLHDALPIFRGSNAHACYPLPRLPPSSTHRRPTYAGCCCGSDCTESKWGDRKSTRLNSSHDQISYAVFCLKKKNIHTNHKRDE